MNDSVQNSYNYYSVSTYAEFEPDVTGRSALDVNHQLSPNVAEYQIVTTLQNIEI